MAKYQPGDRVKHRHWGIGTVLTVDSFPRWVFVRFDDSGQHIALHRRQVRIVTENEPAVAASTAPRASVTTGTTKCVICGQPIEGKATKKTCSDKCRKALSRKGVKHGNG